MAYLWYNFSYQVNLQFWFSDKAARWTDGPSLQHSLVSVMTLLSLAGPGLDII